LQLAGLCSNLSAAHLYGRFGSTGFGPLCADCVEEVSELATGAGAACKRLSSSDGHRSRWRDQFCQLSKVLSGGGEQELVASAARTSQPEPIEAQDAL
jgi:hypothetical protein